LLLAAVVAPPFLGPFELTVLMLIVIFALLAMSLDLLIGYSPFPGYGALLGLGGCVAIVLVSKWLGTALLQRPEDYYPDDVAPDVQEDVRGR
jgi:ABC-type branched-subunit amino acid transport system permease subunit